MLQVYRLSSARKALLVVFALSTFSGSAFAAGESVRSGGSAESSRTGPGSATFESLDSNRSGFIEQGEADRSPGLGFISADTDGDGRLDRQEFEAARRGKPVPGGDGGGAPVVPGSTP